MKRAYGILLSLLLVSCAPRGGHPSADTSLLEARQNFETQLVRQDRANQPVPIPPSNHLQTVRYASPVGDLSAYLSEPPTDGRKHPAIIWVFGGFGNSIDETAWLEAPADNDQSARAFAEAGIVTMYPSFRGGNTNPGVMEGFFGEVDDVIAAAEYLATQDFVDPDRIYLAGHSTGGTLALLAAASSDRFRAVFSFGPVDNVGVYGRDSLPFDTSNGKELELRAPVRWMHSIQSPTFVLEGTASPSNIDVLQILENAEHDAALVSFHPVLAADHFNILEPATRLVATKILQDTASTTNIEFTETELNSLFSK